nr:uncharacterized protein LOC108942959 [Nicotiana tomentosiformis]
MYKIKEMRADIKTVFNTNVSYGKCKRAKRLILEKLDIYLTAPQCSQASQGIELVFMLTPSVYSETSSSSFPAFEYPEPEIEPAIRPMVVSEEKTRLQQRQQPSQPSGSRIITFKGDHNGLSVPSNLPYSPRRVTWKGKVAITVFLFNLVVNWRSYYDQGSVSFWGL